MGNPYKKFGSMVAEFQSNWNKINEAAKKKQEALNKASGKSK
tara:strand:- start:2334 stop:2459 length:126 start_codon:yes stop_codon:yes gene_type:complete